MLQMRLSICGPIFALRLQELIFTARAQRVSKWYEEAAAGKLTLTENLERQLKRARAKHERLKDALESIAEGHPEVSQELRRTLMHHMSAELQAPDQAAIVQTESQSAPTLLTEVTVAKTASETTQALNASLNTSEANAGIEKMQAC